MVSVLGVEGAATWLENERRLRLLFEKAHRQRNSREGSHHGRRGGRPARVTDDELNNTWRTVLQASPKISGGALYNAISKRLGGKLRPETVRGRIRGLV